MTFQILGKPFSTTELHSQPSPSHLHIYCKGKAFSGGVMAEWLKSAGEAASFCTQAVLGEENMLEEY